ncbi:MAG TPA: hypothetical protein VJ550_00650 [Geomonas sp.]|nr:hypothetical protein [Geomonas sp.]
MGKLPCNIAMYHPDLRVLSARYRFWHVETLLNDASLLIDRCLADYREYSSLDYAWNQFKLHLTMQEKRFDVDGQREPERAPEEEVPHPEETPPEEEASAAAPAVEMSEEEPAPVEAVFETPPTSAPPPPALDLGAEEVIRKRELAAPGQPFALNELRDLTLKRVCRDYEEAVNRAWVAEQGLKKIYDHVDLTSPLPTEAETLSESITNLAIWIRDAQEWLVRYQQHEQIFTRTVSVRSLLGRTAWQVLKQSRDSYTAKLRIPPDFFQTHDNCLLKGLGAWLVGEVGAVPWSITVRFPEEALYERWGQSVDVDQTGRPSVLLGRVENRRSIHPVELCGGNSLLNASPIGQPTPGGLWIVEISKPSGAVSESFLHLEDIVIEISAAGIPQRSMGS